MANNDIKYQALIDDFQGKISELHEKIDATTDEKERARLEQELFQMRELVLNLAVFPERVFCSQYRLN